MISPTLFSSNSTEWETPDEIFKPLDAEFHFMLDPAASEKNAKCTKFFWARPVVRRVYGPNRTPALVHFEGSNGLVRSWYGVGAVFVNPPYAEPEQPCAQANCVKKKCHYRGWHTLVYIPGTGDWMEKCVREAFGGVTVVALVHSRTDTQWWHKWVESYAAEVRFVRGRVNFKVNGKPGEANAPFPSAIVIYGGKLVGSSPGQESKGWRKNPVANGSTIAVGSLPRSESTSDLDTERS